MPQPETTPRYELRAKDGTPMVATIHPSWLLRIRESETREKERAAFVADLRRGWELAGG